MGENANKWENISDNGATQVSRHKVDGGWLYCVTTLGARSHTTTFVPDVDLARYQAHLRDSYKKGYADGQEDSKNGILNEDEGLTAFGI